MPSTIRLTTVVVVCSAVIFSLAFLTSDNYGTEASHAGGMDAMSIDVDTSGNTATSLGSRNDCVEANEGDSVTIDVTALNVPSTTAMSAFSYQILYDDSRLQIETQDHQFFLAANTGSGLFNVSQPTPDENGDGQWTAGVLDTTTTPEEAGSGVLSRLTIRVGAGTAPGMYPLAFGFGAHIDRSNTAYPADETVGAMIAVEVACPPVSGTPTPLPTPTPTPAPTPVPSSVSITLDPEAHLDLKNNEVTLSGVVRCATPGEVLVSGEIHQFVRGVTVAGATNGILLGCDDEVAWSISVVAWVGEYKPGWGEALVEAHVSGQTVGASGPIRLKPGAVK